MTTPFEGEESVSAVDETIDNLTRLKLIAEELFEFCASPRYSRETCIVELFGALLRERERFRKVGLSEEKKP